jgi:nicotinamidase/pyrazinamidase
VNALIIVDVQNDFLPGGALPVARGDEIVPVINSLQIRFDLVIATQDWHPANHESFASNHHGRKPGDRIELHGLQQILWPVHCVQHTPGAALVAALERKLISEVFHKGTDPTIDSYSGFFDNGHRRATGLGDFLNGRHVTDVYVAGLATDYCVKFTAMDAVKLGFKTRLIEDACRGVNLQPDDSARAIDEMKQAGVLIVQSSQIPKRI